MVVIAPYLLYSKTYSSRRDSDASYEDEAPVTPRKAPKLSHNERVRAALRTMTAEEHSAVLAPLKGRHRRRMAREIAKIVHERHLQALRSGLL